MNEQYALAYHNRGYIFNYWLGLLFDDLGRKEEAI